MILYLKKIFKKLLEDKPSVLDTFILSCFLILITLHPFYLWGEINLFELGLYLPGIDAILNHQIPYRDFFHLRGPLELYVPAWLMMVFSQNIAILPSYFYFGTIITLIFCVLIGKELFQSRLFFYSLVPVLIARAFPRVSFTINGGMRFAFGLMAIFFLIQFLKRNKKWWIFLSGILTALAFLTSIDVGVYAFLSISGVFFIRWLFIHDREYKPFFVFFIYGTGMVSIILPCLLYLANKEALVPFLNSMYYVATNMVKVFPQTDPVPSSIAELIFAMINPTHTNFKQLTPIYCYLAMFAYLGMKLRNKRLPDNDLGIICLMFYGGLMYWAAFCRSLWGPAFETALQPEKILFFLLMERFYFFLKGCHLRQKILVNLFLIVIIGWSLGYSIQRYNKRFFAFKFVRNVLLGKETQSLIPLAGQEQASVNIDRLKGMVVPYAQAQDFGEVNQFIQKHTKPGEPIFTFPDLGLYHFIVDRPFAGRFPMATLSWIGQGWHEELMWDIRETPPSYILTRKKLPDYFEKTSFAYPPNKKKFEEIINYIQQDYSLVFSTPNVEIYGRK